MWPALATNVLNLRFRVGELDENIGLIARCIGSCAIWDRQDGWCFAIVE
jgi:hypothetical protein